MNKSVLFLAACLVLVSPLTYGATVHAGIFGFGEEPETYSSVENIMSGRKLEALARNRTFYLETPFGSEMPITFYSDGSVKGKAGSVASYLSKGRTTHSDSGKWWVEGRSICSRWNIWFDKDTFCLKARKNGAKIMWWSNKGQSGKARLGQPIIREAQSINDLLEKYK